ncbi:MAG: HD domain-containing phosphohydrolase [Alphaproteobacteria bacterium]
MARSTDQPAIGSAPRTVGLTFTALAIGLFAAAVIGVLMVVRLVDSERDRDLHAWQVRLGIVADSRAAAVTSWTEGQYATLRALAENASLQIYLTELAAARGDPAKATTAAAQAGYLRNLLTVTASRGGFTGKAAGPQVDANVERTGVAGVALVAMDGSILVATSDMPPMAGALGGFVAGLAPGTRGLAGPYPGPSGRPTMAFAVPIFAVQGDPVASQQVGLAVGVKEIEDDLYPLLRQPGATEKTAETLLVRSDGTVIEYISPLADGTRALGLKLAMSTPDSAEAFAITTPGGFALKTDYRNRQVLVASRRLEAAPWTLVHKVDRAEALGESDARAARLLSIFLLAIACVAAGVLAAWWQGSSRRAREAAQSYRDLAARFESQKKLLQLVTDSQPDSIFIVNSDDDRIRFANRAVAKGAGTAAADLVGKTLASVFGPDAAKRYRIRNRQAAAADVAISAVDRAGEGEQMRVLHTEHIPLAATAHEQAGVLVVESDITEAVTERERRERIMRQLVKTLVAAIDRRDPHSANHSVRVGRLARATALEMGLDMVAAEAAEIAGNLMNLGKILVPPELLTKVGALDPNELRRVRESLQTTAELLSGIEFDGPVLETLRQCQEHVDGSGWPRGIAGDDIAVTARIVAAANAFVAMVSPRSYRAGVSIDDALAALLAGVGKTFDRGVVAALINHMDNRGGRAQWAALDALPAAG